MILDLLLISLCYNLIFAGPDEFYILSLNDLHMDPYYDKTASKSLWCRLETPTTQTPLYADDTSGHYGRYGCDSPYSLIELSVKEAAAKLAAESIVPDLILVNGDVVAHALPSIDVVSTLLTNFTSLVDQYFPNVPVAPTIGNNEAWPDYNLSHTLPDYQLDNMAYKWGEWLSPSEQSTFKQGGYYVRDLPGTNMRLVVINSVYYSTHFSHADELDPLVDDPMDQLQWLETQIRLANRQVKSVVLATHTPPGDNGYDDSELWQDGFTTRFLAIIDKHPDVVTATFYGHFHHDEFRIIETRHTSKSNGDFNIPGYVLPSVAPVNYNNPGFRVTTLHTESGQPLDYAQWYLDLQLANREDEEYVGFEFMYSFMDTYINYIGVAESPSGLALRLITSQMAYDAELWELWLAYSNLLYSSHRENYICATLIRTSVDYEACLETYPSD